MPSEVIDDNGIIVTCGNADVLIEVIDNGDLATSLLSTAVVNNFDWHINIATHHYTLSSSTILLGITT